MIRNVYDFDKTIYDGDSTQNFFFYLLKKQPKIMIYLPKQIYYLVLFYTGKMEKTKAKEKFYMCFNGVKNIEKEVENFWDKNIFKIKKFYYDTQKDNDIIISASPEFLLRPICDRLNIKYLIASKVDKNTGKYTGANCYGEEKVKRLNEEIPNTIINEFYSDSISDAPLANIAKTAYMVLGNRIYLLKDWKKGYKIKK